MLINGREHIAVDKEGLIAELNNVKSATSLSSAFNKVDNLIKQVQECP